MQDANYFRAQAERCLRLAKAINDAQAAEKLTDLAEEYRLKAEQPHNRV